VFVVHGTKKLRDRVKRPTAEPVERSTTALGSWYATALFWKPHVALGEGEINTDWSDWAIECPLHGSVFDVRTGEVLNPPAPTPVRTYPVEVDGGVVKVSTE